MVYDAIFSAGDFRLTQIESGGERLTLAARGSWIFSDRQAANEILNIFRLERQFWGETKPNRFLVILVPYDQDLGSSDGTVFTGVFLLYLSRKQTFLTDEKSRLEHEVFHTWNPYRMDDLTVKPRNGSRRALRNITRIESSSRRGSSAIRST